MLVGRVAGSFGVHGDMKVDLQTDFPDRFSQLSTVYLGPERRPFEVQQSRKHGGRILLKLAGVDAPERIKDLHGLDIFVPRSEAMVLPEGHYYLDDLVGMSVETIGGEAVGRITDVLQTGANDVYVVNEGRKEVLVPATKDAIASLDLETRRVVVMPWVLEAEG